MTHIIKFYFRQLGPHTYIGRRSENNIKCVVVHNDLGRKNRTTRYNCRFSAASLALRVISQFHSCGTYSVLSRSPSRSAWLRLGGYVAVTLMTFDKQSNGRRFEVEPRSPNHCNYRWRLSVDVVSNGPVVPWQVVAKSRRRKAFLPEIFPLGDDPASARRRSMPVQFMRCLQLRFDFDSTAVRRPFDVHSITYGRSLRSQWRNPLAVITLTFSLQSAHRDVGRGVVVRRSSCSQTTVEWQSNPSRIVVIKTALNIAHCLRRFRRRLNMSIHYYHCVSAPQTQSFGYSTQFLFSFRFFGGFWIVISSCISSDYPAAVLPCLFS